MSNMKLKRVIGIALVLTVFCVAGFAHADNAPSNEEVAFAQRTSDLLLNELLAALFQEFNETTPANIQEGKNAISLIFNNSNRDMRLVGTFGPLQGGDNDLPSDGFEQTALGLALQGEPHTSVEQVNDRWYYRRSIALSNAFHQSCSVCHTNFTKQFFKSTHNPGQWVGALTLRVPIGEN